LAQFFGQVVNKVVPAGGGAGGGARVAEPMDRQTCRRWTADNVRHTRKVLDGLGLVLAPVSIRTSSTRYSIFYLTLRFIFLHGDISFCTSAHSHEPRRFRHAFRHAVVLDPLPPSCAATARCGGQRPDEGTPVCTIENKRHRMVVSKRAGRFASFLAITV
jgi:hypothetical protein